MHLAPTGVAPMRCVARCALDLPLCTVDDQLGYYCGRDPSLQGVERFRPCLDEAGHVVQIDGSLGWTFVAITGRRDPPSGAMPRGRDPPDRGRGRGRDEPSCMGEQELFFALTPTLTPTLTLTLTLTLTVTPTLWASRSSSSP